jgi:hypothetical protein
MRSIAYEELITEGTLRLAHQFAHVCPINPCGCITVTSLGYCHITT